MAINWLLRVLGGTAGGDGACLKFLRKWWWIGGDEVWLCEGERVARLSPTGCEVKLRWYSSFGDFNECSSSSTRDAILMCPSGSTITRERSHLTLVCSAPAPKNVGISETMRSRTRLVARFFDRIVI